MKPVAIKRALGGCASTAASSPGRIKLFAVVANQKLHGQARQALCTQAAPTIGEGVKDTNKQDFVEPSENESFESEQQQQQQDTQQEQQNEPFTQARESPETDPRLHYRDEESQKMTVDPGPEGRIRDATEALLHSTAVEGPPPTRRTRRGRPTGPFKS